MPPLTSRLWMRMFIHHKAFLFSGHSVNLSIRRALNSFVLITVFIILQCPNCVQGSSMLVGYYCDTFALPKRTQKRNSPGLQYCSAENMVRNAEMPGIYVAFYIESFTKSVKSSSGWCRNVLCHEFRAAMKM